ncbi:YbjQ family protein [Actinacidiphila bryophytorum]|uniref:YbjQ family protein n=1 Tax=Actinacidiphila bryophytorum TaxID=1436133 RepID=UPI002176BAB0|nr:YbjQ family protein [Actinacidiphila bryophytorum]UWE07472.1 YbjQ family protein [Actinacidiphila bryophytorum]
MAGPEAADPAAAAGRERTARSRAGGTWDSALSAQEFAAVESAGFDPVGQVLGTAVFQIGYTGAWDCAGPWQTAGTPDLSSSRWAPYAPLVRVLYTARRTVVGRAASECRALGGDGVVGLTLRMREFPAGGVEFSALGTAVRARSRTRPHRVFTSHLGGQDFARLLDGGWVPTGLAFGISIAALHGDLAIRRQTRWTAGNQEVDGYTRLVTYARRDARTQLARNAAANGGDGVVVEAMQLQVRDRSCSQGSHDHIAEAVFAGTSVARFGRQGRRSGPGPLTIMRLERGSGNG